MEEGTPPCPCCLKVKPLDERIAETRAFLQHLEAHRAALMSGANTFQDLLTALFPAEISSRILSSCVDEEEVEMSVPLALSAVSKRWRAIAHTTPSLWTSIRVRSGFYGRQDMYEEMLRDWLPRSAPQLLSISLRIEDTDDDDALKSQYRPILDVLNQHCNRWGKLSIEMPLRILGLFKTKFHDGPPLHSLSISPPDEYDDNDDVNQFGKFDLGATLPAPEIVLISCKVSRIHINWANVTSVSVSGPQVHECVALFAAAPQLRECKLTRVRDGANTTNVDPIVHQQLRNLTVQMSADSISPFFDNLAFPSLEFLKYHAFNQPLTSLSSFLACSSCPLKSLSIGENETADHRDELFEILWTLPSLEELERIGASSFEDFFELLASGEEYSHERRFLPSLTKLFLDNTAGLQGFSWRDASMAVNARTSPYRSEHGHAFLKEFRWDMYVPEGEDGYYIDEGSLQVFERLIAGGVAINLSNGWQTDGKPEDMIVYSRAFYEAANSEPASNA